MIKRLLLLPLRLLSALLPSIPARPITDDPAWDIDVSLTPFPCRWCGARACDCVDRIKCPLAGQVMHLACGWCETHKAPRFECLCAAPAELTRRAQRAP